MAGTTSTNFDFLAKHDAQLVRLATLAERYFSEDPSTALTKLRQFSELLAKLVAAHFGLLRSPEESQADLLRRLKAEAGLQRQVLEVFHYLRKSGNTATHDFTGTHGEALTALKLARQLGILKANLQGLDQPYTNTSALSQFAVPLPEKSEQEVITGRIETAFSWLDKLVNGHARAERLLPKLDQAILAKAFGGELVPQDPNDEPPSELLERIRANRGSAPRRIRQKTTQ